MKPSALLFAMALTLYIEATLGAPQIELLPIPQPTAAMPEIVGGVVATPADWPATFIFTSPTGARCTATAIGKRVILTAAHCLDGQIRGKISLSNVTLTCEAHQFYKLQSGYDISLCLTSADLLLPKSAPFETLKLNGATADNSELVLLGYGCTATLPAGNLYVGTSNVEPKSLTYPYFFSQGGVGVCGGDSGGAVYQPGGIFRKIVGVAAADYGQERTRITSLASPSIAAFISKWAATRLDPQTAAKLLVEICGLPNSPYTCRG